MTRPKGMSLWHAYEDTIDRVFEYHHPDLTTEQRETVREVQDYFQDLARKLKVDVPRGPFRAEAFQALHTAAFKACEQVRLGETKRNGA